MNDSIDGGEAAAGLPGDHFPHQPVLYHEVLEALAPVSGRSYLDGTLGAGGHAEGILLDSAPRGRLLGLDLDPEALAIARQRLAGFADRTIVRLASCQQAPDILQEIGWGSVDGIILDLGISSMQLDRPERGFSFRDEGPLDMRFNQEAGKTAADLVNKLSEEELARIIWKYGEERYSRRIARAIVEARPIQTTKALAELVQKTIPGYSSKIHPATRTFQALRIATNAELEVLSSALPGLVHCLSPGGRIAVISFHSLEDRIVKNFFKEESKDCICPPEQPICTCNHVASLNILTGKPVRPKAQEIKSNPRSSSAKLRVAERLSEKKVTR
jgi:16S rRNA (cytosine1402-N4)-methyltransferase